jgi:hypothetical protein
MRPLPLPCSLLLLLSSAAAVQHLGGFPCKSGLTAGPGFLSYDSAVDSLVVSLFTGDPLEQDAIFLVRQLSSLLLSGNVSSAVPFPLTSSIDWPNSVQPVALPLGQGGSAGTAAGLLAPGGFLVPPKTVGSVSFVNLSSSGSLASPPVKLTQPKGIAVLNGWFYHCAYAFDVDKDGLVDVLAARASKPLLGASSGELVWARQPEGPEPLAAAPWATEPLLGGASAPDVFFTQPASLRQDSDEQVFYTSFFTGGGLAMTQCSGCSSRGNGSSWAAAAAAGSLSATVLDASIGPSFGLSSVDLNGDGINDLLVTNHVDNASSPFASGVFAYVAPAAPTPLTSAASWTRHELALGFAVREPGPNQAAPGGAATLLLPGTSKPLIALSGDGDQRAYILQAAEQGNPDSWDYSLTELWDCKGTVGTVLPLLSGGRPYAVVACYDSGRLEVFAL